MSDLAYYRDLVLVLTQKEIKARYKSNVLGYLWSIGNPLAFAFVYYVVFKIFARVKIEDYSIFLICGLFPWQWFANSVSAAPSTFLGNASIIKKTNFPRNIVPLAVVLQDGFHFVLSLPVIVLFLFLFHKIPHLSWIYGVPVLLAVHGLMTYGAVLLIATLNLFFRDMERLTIIMVTFAFYFTPVLYSPDLIPEHYRRFVMLNPMAPLMINWRKLLLYGDIEPRLLAISLGYAVLSFAIGYMVYRKLSWRFPEVL